MKKILSLFLIFLILMSFCIASAEDGNNNITPHDKSRALISEDFCRRLAAEDAALLTQGKNDNSNQRQKYRLASARFVVWSNISEGGADLSDISKIKSVLKANISNKEIDPRDKIELWREDGSFLGVDYQSDDRADWKTIYHLQYVRDMVKSAYSEGNKHFGDEELKRKIAKSLEYWVKGGHKASLNWWYDEIGIPQVMVDILLFEPKGIEPEIIAALNADADKGAVFNEKISDRITERPVASTGANLTDKLITTFKIAVATDNEDSLLRVIKLLENELRVFPKIRTDEFGEDAEGIKPDYSFHQHVDQIQLGSYGEVFMTGVNTILKNVKGTKYMPNDTALNEYANFILDGMQWAFRYDYKDITTTGRSIARPNASKGIRGGVRNAVELMSDMTQLERYSELIKLKENRLGENDIFSGNRHFWLSDFMAHKRDGYHIGLKIASNRTKLGEVINGENILGYYLSDGVTNIMRRGDEYENIYPVWNWNRLPGTTTLQGGLKDLRDSDEWNGEHLWNWKGNNSFVGGVSDGLYGAAVMDYTRDGMTAHKSWFMFDKEMVALGNGINTYTNMAVYTNINQCILNGKVIVGRNNVTSAYEFAKQTFNKTDFIYHDGIGYISPNQMELISEKRKGLWETVNAAQINKPEEKAVFELGINHGRNPKNAKYEYTMLLDTTLDECMKYAKKPAITVLQNDDKIQAVYNKDLKMLQAVVWKGENAIKLPSGLTVRTNKKCLLMVEELPDKNLKVTISNPENNPKDMFVYVNREYTNVDGSYDMIVSKGQTTIKLRLPEGIYSGSSLVVYTKSK